MYQGRSDAVVQAAHIDTAIGSNGLEDLKAVRMDGGAIVVDGRVGSAPDGLRYWVADSWTFENCRLAMADNEASYGLLADGDQQRGSHFWRLVGNGYGKTLRHFDLGPSDRVDSHTGIDTTVVGTYVLQDQRSGGELGKCGRN